MKFLEHLAVLFFKRLSTVNQSLWCYFNRVLREQRCESGCVGLVGCIVKLLSTCITSPPALSALRVSTSTKLDHPTSVIARASLRFLIIAC